MSRTPAQGVDAIDRDAQYLMKIKRRVARDTARDEEERKEIENLLVKTIGLLYKHTPAVVLVPPNGGIKPFPKRKQA